jgi:hypothetical protein
MRKSTTLFLLALLPALLLGVTQAAPPAKNLPQWKSSPQWSTKLAPARKFNFGEIRAPKGYALQQKPAPGGQGYAWVGVEGEDGTRPYLMLMSLTMPEAEAKKYTAEAVLNAFLQGVKARHENWSRSIAERGTINGRSLVQISSQQTQPDDYGALKLAEAAALTFKKK